MSTALEKLRLKLDSDGDGTTDKSYDIYPIEEVTIRSRKDAFSIAPPGLAARENILLGVSGMEADIEIQAFVWDDGTDRANGTHTSAVTSVEDQITYLEDEIHAPDFAASWELDHLNGSAFNDDDVFVESVEPTVLSAQNRKWKPVRIGLRRGGSV
jgi:hypothetical protein